VRNLLRSRGETGFAAWSLPTDPVAGLQENAPVFDRHGVVALITSRPERAVQMKHSMQGFLRDALVPMTRDQALALSSTLGPEAAAVPDIFVIDADLDTGPSGLQLMSELNSRPATRYSATCIVTAEDDDAQAAMAFDLGADDVVPRLVSPRELAMRLRILLRRKRQGDVVRASVEDGLRMAVIDPLTGVYNRRYAMPRLAGIAAQAAQEENDFAVMVVDLDRFKSVNDRFGHAAGDVVLSEVARRLSENLRMTDLLARIGGEEFLVALPNTAFDDAERVSDRLRRVIAEAPVVLPSGQQLRVTASIGVALGTGCGQRVEDVAGLIDRADRALLQSKQGGRNQVTFSQNAA
jgi:two-component system cell cycle response regulator